MDCSYTLFEGLRDEILRRYLRSELDDAQFSCATVLFAAVEVGADIRKIVETTNLDEDFVRGIERRMRASGLWVDGIAVTEDWVIDEYFNGQFYEHLLVAEGRYARRIEDGCETYFPVVIIN